MKILVIKLTSMGDVLHLLPALTILQHQCPSAQVDWVVEDSFSEIPKWHTLVRNVIPVSTRRWRKINREVARDIVQSYRRLRIESYDLVIDAQGLMKSAVISRFVRLNKGGRRIGFSRESLKEKPAAFFYAEKISVSRNQHAIDRLNQLIVGAANLKDGATNIDYGLSQHNTVHNLDSDSHNSLEQNKNEQSKNPPSKRIVFLHGTTWPSKHLPDQYWRDLRDYFLKKGYSISLAWGSNKELARANWIAEGLDGVTVLPKSSLSELRDYLRNSTGAIAVDTGLGHLAAAVGLPTVSVYGPTNSALTGAVGERQKLLQAEYPCSPCFLKTCDKLSAEQSSPPCYKSTTAPEIAQSLIKLIA